MYDLAVLGLPRGHAHPRRPADVDAGGGGEKVSDVTTPRPRRIGEHALVIGGSLAGLLAARVLSDAYDRVTVLDRDTLPAGVSDQRRGVPQGHHVHTLRLGGQAALEELFAGLRDEALAAGAPPMRATTDMRVRVGGHRIARVPIGSDYVVASRPLVEGLVRRRVRGLTNVTVRERCDVLALAGDGERVTGVKARDRAPGSEVQTLRADLVVAATGRGGRVPAWLEALGCERPDEQRVDVEIVYVSRLLRLRPGALGTDRFVLDSASSERPRGMVMIMQERDCWIVTLFGYGAAQHPPTDPAGFNAFAATVADPDTLAAIEQAEPLDRIVTHAYPASVRRRYDRLKRFPDGLLITGDALCSFNPVYAQGMTVAAYEAAALQRCLRDGDRHLARRFFKEARETIEPAWRLSTGADLALPQVEGRAPLPGRVISRYMERLFTAAEHDEHVARAFAEVMGMLAQPSRLLHPAIMMRVLRRTRYRPGVRAALSSPARIDHLQRPRLPD